MPDRITDEQIAEWGTWVDGVLMDAGVDITPMLDALVAERERADQAQALAAWFAAEHEFWIKQHIEAGALERTPSTTSAPTLLLPNGLDHWHGYRAEKLAAAVYLEREGRL